MMQQELSGARESTGRSSLKHLEEVQTDGGMMVLFMCVCAGQRCYELEL